MLPRCGMSVESLTACVCAAAAQLLSAPIDKDADKVAGGLLEQYASDPDPAIQEALEELVVYRKEERERRKREFFEAKRCVASAAGLTLPRSILACLILRVPVSTQDHDKNLTRMPPRPSATLLGDALLLLWG